MRRRTLVGVASAVAVVMLGLALARREAELTDPTVLLEAKLRALQEQKALAEEDARYLVLDPEAGTLTLFHGAAVLRAWPVSGMEAGARRLLPEGEGWRARRWDGARVEPPVERDRRVIVSDAVTPPDLTGAVEWVPPLPEQAIPTPPRFVVHYHGGLGLEVLAAATDSARAEAGLLTRLEHRLRRLHPANWDRYRIRVAIPADEAGALYRSLPDSTSLVAVLPHG